MKEFDVQAMVARAKAGWRTPAILMVISVLYTLYTLSGAKPVYRMTMTVVPAPSDQGGTTVASGGALSTLLGVGGIGGGNSNYARYQKLLVSPVTAQRMEKKYGLIEQVFSNQWDKREKKWIQPITLRTYLLGWLFDLSNVPIWTAPDATTLATSMDGSLVILPGIQTDITTISMDSTDPEFARKLMLADHEMANAVLRDQVARRARQQVGYLQAKLAGTTVEDYRQTLLSLLSSQEKTLMLTQTDASFAAEILSPPVASPTPVGPRPVLSVFIAVLAGILIGFGIVVFLGPDWWRAPYGRGHNLLDRLRGGRRVATQQH